MNWLIVAFTVVLSIGHVNNQPLPLLPPSNIFNPIIEKYIEYQDQTNYTMKGFITYPFAASRHLKLPAIIVFHAFAGRTSFEEDRARALARLGYVAFAADVYGAHQSLNISIDQKFGLMNALLSNRTTSLRQRILAAWNTINKFEFVDKQRIGSVGYCFGGLCSLDLARFTVGLKAVVSFHGTLTDYPGNGTRIDASIQAHHGDEDPHTTNNDADNFLVEMRRRNGDWTFHRYAHAQHAFTLHGVDDFGIPGAKYNALAANRSWTAMETFLAEKLLF